MLICIPTLQSFVIFEWYVGDSKNKLSETAGLVGST